MSKQTFFTIRIPPELRSAAQRVADAQSITLGEYIRRVLSDAVVGDETAASMINNPVLMSALTGVFKEPGFIGAMSEVLKGQLSDKQLKLFSTEIHNLGKAASPGGRSSQAAKYRRRAG